MYYFASLYVIQSADDPLNVDQYYENEICVVERLLLQG